MTKIFMFFWNIFIVFLSAFLAAMVSGWWALLLLLILVEV